MVVELHAEIRMRVKVLHRRGIQIQDKITLGIATKGCVTYFQ